MYTTVLNNYQLQRYASLTALIIINQYIPPFFCLCWGERSIYVLPFKTWHMNNITWLTLSLLHILINLIARC